MEDLEACSGTQQFMMMLLERVQGIEQGPQQLAHAARSPADLAQHDTREMQDIKKQIRDQMCISVDERPSDAALKELARSGYAVVLKTVDKQELYRQCKEKGCCTEHVSTDHLLQGDAVSETYEIELESRKQFRSRLHWPAYMKYTYLQPVE